MLLYMSIVNKAVIQMEHSPCTILCFGGTMHTQKFNEPRSASRAERIFFS